MKNEILVAIAIILVGFSCTKLERNNPYDNHRQDDGVISSPDLQYPANQDVVLSSEFNLYWSVSIDYDYCEIEIATDENFTNIFLKKSNLSADSLVIPYFGEITFLSGTKYYWRVRAVKGLNISNWSPTWSFSLASTLDLSIENVGSDHVSETIDLYYYRSDSINCENLLGFTHEAYGSSSFAEWSVGNGFVGNGFICTNCTGGTVEFLVNLNTDSYMTFWMENIESGGTAHILPLVKIDGLYVNTTTHIASSIDSWSNWIQAFPIGKITSGNHLIEIIFPSQNTFRTISLDEIELWSKL
jgi:hypothetical protein